MKQTNENIILAIFLAINYSNFEACEWERIFRALLAHVSKEFKSNASDMANSERARIYDGNLSVIAVLIFLMLL